MSRKMRYLGLILTLILLLAFISGCASQSKDMVSEEPSAPNEGMPMPSPAVPSEPAERPAEEGDFGKPDFGTGSGGSIEPDKIITTISLGFESTEFDKSLEELYKLIEENKGYISSSNIYFGNYYGSQMYRTGNFSIRIPRDMVNQFKAFIPQIGNIISESSSKEDVTRYYTDTESRLGVLEIKEERLLSLLERAEKIEDIIALENQLSEVIFEKENLKATLINLDDRIDYSTFNITINEVAKVTSTETVETTFFTKIKNAFNNSLYQFRRSLENFVIFLIYNLPGIIVLLIVAFFGFKGIKKIVKPKLDNKKHEDTNKPS